MCFQLSINLWCFVFLQFSKKRTFKSKRGRNIEHTLLFDEVTLPLEKESFCGKGLLLEAAGTSADLYEPGRGFPAVSSLSGPVRHQLEFVRPARGKRVLAQVLQAGDEHPADTSSQVGRVV